MVWGELGNQSFVVLTDVVCLGKVMESAHHGCYSPVSFSSFSCSWAFWSMLEQMCSRKFGIKGRMEAGEVADKVYLLLNSQWPYRESQPNQLTFDDIINEVAVPSWRTGKVSESMSTELCMWSSFRPLTSVGGKMWCCCLMFECSMWEDVFENELSHCLAGDLDCSEFRCRRVLPGIAVKPMINIQWS